MLGAVALLAILAAFFLGFGWYAYRGKSASYLLKNQFFMQLFPQFTCTIPLTGLICLLWAVALSLPRAIGGPIIVASLPIVALDLFLLVIWCPRALMPRWLK